MLQESSSKRFRPCALRGSWGGVAQCSVLACVCPPASEHEKVLPDLHAGFTLTIVLSCNAIVAGILRPAPFGNHCLCLERVKNQPLEQISKLAHRNIAREPIKHLDALSVS